MNPKAETLLGKSMNEIVNKETKTKIIEQLNEHVNEHANVNVCKNEHTNVTEYINEPVNEHENVNVNKKHVPTESSERRRKRARQRKSK